MTTHLFALMWDCHGLEAIVDVTQAQHQRLLDILGDKEKDHYSIPNLMHWKLRAQFNSQRHYEIYLLEAQDGITAQDIKQAFDEDPQTIVDTIRKIGHCYHSDRQVCDQVKIR